MLQAGIDPGSHLEAIAGIRLAVIPDSSDQVLPQGPPRRAGQVQRCGEPGRVSVREVETDENALPFDHQVTQGITDDQLCLAPRRRVLR